MRSSHAGVARALEHELGIGGEEERLVPEAAHPREVGLDPPGRVHVGGMTRVRKTPPPDRSTPAYPADARSLCRPTQRYTQVCRIRVRRQGGNGRRRRGVQGVRRQGIRYRLGARDPLLLRNLGDSHRIPERRDGVGADGTGRRAARPRTCRFFRSGGPGEWSARFAVVSGSRCR